MPTKDQECWADLLDFVLSNEFDVECCWFEDADGKELSGMANRIARIERIPLEAKRLRIDSYVWVRPGESFAQDTQKIYESLEAKSNYIAQIVDGNLYIGLSPEVVG